MLTSGDWAVHLQLHVYFYNKWNINNNLCGTSQLFTLRPEENSTGSSSTILRVREMYLWNLSKGKALMLDDLFLWKKAGDLRCLLETPWVDIFLSYLWELPGLGQLLSYLHLSLSPPIGQWISRMWKRKMLHSNREEIQIENTDRFFCAQRNPIFLSHSCLHSRDCWN